MRKELRVVQYPEVEWKKLEPPERRKVFLNRARVTDVANRDTQPVPANVNVTSASTISTLESSMSKKKSKHVKTLINVSNEQMR